MTFILEILVDRDVQSLDINRSPIFITNLELIYHLISLDFRILGLKIKQVTYID